MSDIRPQITDLVAKLSTKSDAQSLAILQRLTRLFLDKCGTFCDEHTAVFDDILCALLDRAPDEALAELSEELASIDNPPKNVVAYLAQHDNAFVAAPQLENSNLLSDQILAEVAEEKSEKHRAAIAARKQLSATVTDMLVQRAHAAVAYKVAINPQARFSELGFVRLINHAKTDRDLAEALAARTDIPSELEPFLKLALAS
jgi:uncharacterized protein (DUF2336 family)